MRCATIQLIMTEQLTETPEIAFLREEELDKVVPLFIEGFGPGSPVGEPWTEETALAHLQESYNPELSYAARVEDKIIGAVICSIAHFEHGPELYVDSILVTSDYQEQGIGMKLLQRAIESGKQKNLVGLRLVSNPKLASHEWYERMGIAPSGWEERAMLFNKAG